MKLSRSRLLTDPGGGGGAQLHETGSRHRSNRQPMERVEGNGLVGGGKV